MKSRSLTASMLFGLAAANPRSAANAARSIGERTAGQRTGAEGRHIDALQRSARRARSRCQGQAWLNSQWLHRTGCAG